MPKRRTRSPHPGVVLIPPRGEHTAWRVRVDDPDSGGRLWERIDAAVKGADGRRAWAIRRSKALARRRLELEGGAPRATGTGLADAVARYFEDHPQLRESTRALYRACADHFEAWAARAGVERGDDVTRAGLVAFKASRLRVKKRAPVKGAKKGKHTTTETTRSPSTINVELRAVRAVLNYLRRLGLAAHLTSDDLSDALEPLPAPKETIEIMKAADLRRLLDAAVAHDKATFTATREEHSAGIEGKTKRFTPIAPFVAFVLLTGMRFAEALALEWKQVDLEGDGVIQLTTKTKTKNPRAVGLEVSPALHTLLTAMRPEHATGSVFGLSRGEARTAERRLPRFGAPAFSWQVLRQTCGSYLTNAGGIFAAASAYRSAAQLGHSVQVAQRFYVGTVRNVPRDATTLEAAMQIGEQVTLVTKRALDVRQS